MSGPAQPVSEAGSAPRLTGVRLPFDAVPDQVRDWVEETLGAPVVEVRPRVGGMSPAVAASLRAANGSTAFVKAVASYVNPDTPTHFRHETAVLRGLPPAPYRVPLVGAYDDGEWVALLLEDVDGRHPDWDSAADRAAVLDAVQRQTRELTPPAPVLPQVSVRMSLERQLDALSDVAGADLAAMPQWAVERFDSLHALGRWCLESATDESYCHMDVRHDNILIRGEQPVLVDWGMSRRGPHWLDAVVFALEWVDRPDFDEIVDSIGLVADEQRAVTGFVAVMGAYLLVQAIRPAPPGLPNLPEFRRRVGEACLVGVRRRQAW